MEQTFRIDLGAYFAIIDKEDYNLVKDYQWKVVRNKSNFTLCGTLVFDNKLNRKKIVYLHELVKPKNASGLCVKFKDGNRLNCTKNNILYLSRNSYSHLNYDKSSKHKQKGNENFRGVVRVYKSRIKFNGEIIYLGTFTNPKDAALAYNAKAIELFGSFANLNKF